MVKNLPTNTGDMGSIPGPGRSRMLQGSEACSAQQLKPVLRSRRSTTKEATEPQPESSPRSLQLENSGLQQWRPSAAKSKCIFRRLRDYPFMLTMCVVPPRCLRVNQFSYLFFSFQSVQTVLYYKFGMYGIIIWRINCLEKRSHRFNDFP